MSIELTAEQFDLLVSEALDGIPAELAALIENCVILVEAWPPAEEPGLLGLYTVVTLLGQALHRASPIAIRSASWYPKGEATFSDVLAAVRRECWGFLDIRTSARDPSRVEIPRSQLDRLLNAVCHTH